jgi:hypothetical protein
MSAAPMNLDGLDTHTLLRVVDRSHPDVRVLARRLEAMQSELDALACALVLLRRAADEGAGVNNSGHVDLIVKRAKAAIGKAAIVVGARGPVVQS